MGSAAAYRAAQLFHSAAVLQLDAPGGGEYRQRAVYLDYSAPIERIRSKAIEFAGQTKQPGGKLVNVQVTNTSPDAIELRLLVTAASVADTSNLCAKLREKLIGFLQSECPQALPRRRHEISELPVHKSGKGPNTASGE